MAAKKRSKKSAKKAAHKRTLRADVAGPKRRWPLRIVLFAIGLGLGVLGPWVVYLDREAANRFAERQWTQASRLYARPLELHAGRPISASDLELELTAAGLTQNEPLLPGRWRKRGGRYTIALPEVRFAEGMQPAVTLRVDLNGGAIESLSATDGTALDLARLPPAELGSLLPLDERDRTLVPIAEFPTLLVAGIQAVEDRQFGRHHGVDPRAIARAALRNLMSRDVVQGGSTITQQLVKNLFLTSEQTLVRKFNEAIMAISIEARFSKAQILEAYLNDVYLGQTGNRAIHGFGRAAEHYFGLPVQSLSTDQIALLVGMVRGASWYHPTRNPERARARRDLVLGIFRDTGLIEPAEFERARARELDADVRQQGPSRAHPAFIDLVRRQLRADYRESDLRVQGLRIFTTLSPSAQHHAERALAEGLAEVESESGSLQGALVLARPDSGEVRALVGDRNVQRPGFNRALDARRQVGSILKPFVYLLALAQPDRYTLVTPVEDAPLSVPQAGKPDWTPRNYTGESHGIVPLLTALARSYNQATVRVGLDIGIDPLFALLENLGVDPGRDRNPSALLGAVGLTPLQVTQLYQPLAAGGFSTPLRAITDVVDPTDGAVGRYPVRLRPIRERDALALLDFALEEAVTSGTGRSLSNRLRQPAARRAVIRGKTGTTNDRRDAWFAGFTERWLAVVWVGRDDNRPAAVSGATSALPVWARLFDALPHRPAPRQWPGSLEWFWIDWPAGLLAEEECEGARAMPFAAGSQPTEYSSCVRRGLLDRLRGG